MPAMCSTMLSSFGVQVDVLDNAVACVVSDVHAEGKTFAQDAQLKSIAACRTIAQCLNLEHEIHDTASKLCILGFEPLK